MAFEEGVRGSVADGDVVWQFVGVFSFWVNSDGRATHVLHKPTRH